MKTIETDVAVLGAGTAGLTAFRKAQEHHARAVLVESGPYGTMCARVGCMPSKLLVQAADAAHEVARAGGFGVVVPAGVRVDGRAVMERVRRERDRFVSAVVRTTEAIPAEQRVLGSARFVGRTTLQIDDHTRIEANAVVVATGSSPWNPPSLAKVRDRLLSNAELFELEELPGSVAVVGAGIIGLELGQSLHRLGVRTAFFSPSASLGPSTDPDVQAKIREVLGAELTLYLEHELFEVEPAPGGQVRVRFRMPDGRAGDEIFDKLLVAAGRRPNLEALDLAQTGLALGDDGVPLHDRRTMQCGESPIFLAGDVSGNDALLHEAADEGRIAGANAAEFPEVRAHIRRALLAIVFTDPQIAIVGKSHGEHDPGAIEIGEVSYDNQGRARVMGRSSGLVRVYVDRERGCLRGAEMFGPRVEHTAHLLAWAVQQQLTVFEALEMPFYHPVLEEGLRTAFRDAAERLKLTPPAGPEPLSYGPGT